MDPIPYAAAYSKTNGGHYRLAAAHYRGLREAFEQGAPFFTGIDVDGAELCIRLREIEAVGNITVAAISHNAERQPEFE